MLRFFTRIFAIIGILVVLLIAGASGFAYYTQEHLAKEPKSLILVLGLDQDIVEKETPSAFDFALHEDVTSLFDIVQAIELAKKDPHVKGIVARFGDMQPTLTQSQEIRDALARFRESGKFTYAYGSSYGSFGSGNRAYYIASAFDNIWLQPIGSVGLNGLAVQVPFGKAALDKAGISADFLKREEYKSAMDTFTRDDFVPEVKIETQGMIDNFAAQIAEGVAANRKMTADQVKQLMDGGPYTDDEALKNGLITHIGYADELEDELNEKAGKDTPRISVEDYLSYDRAPNTAAETKIALIMGSGMITDKADGPAGIPGEHALGADELAEAFNDAADDKSVKAILFRVNSPGGSPEASETIRRALVQAQKKGKPVIVSMGDVAASGGYWVAMNADKIIAEPATITGSIGVFAGKFVLGGLMEKLGVNWATLKTTDTAGMWSMTEPFSPAQRARIDALLDNTYRAFVKNVSDARKIPMEKMPELAKGRVWTGEQASKNGLVDALGGYTTTLDALRDMLNLPKNAVLSLEPFPPPETPYERVMKFLKNAGLESAALGPLFLEWQSVESMLAPFHQVKMKPVEVLLPEAAFGTAYKN